MDTRTKLILVAIVPGLFLVVLIVNLALGDMTTVRMHVAETAAEMVTSGELQSKSSGEIRNILYQVGEDKQNELSSSAIPVIIMIMIALVATGLFLVSRTLREINFVVAKVKQMSNPNTPLNFRIDTSHCKEFKALAIDLNGMLERIENVFLRVRDMSDSLDSTSKDLESTAHSNQHNSSSLQRNMDSVATAMTELQSSSQEIASNVQAAHQEVSDVNTEGQELSANIRKLTVQLDELREVTSNSSRDVGELSNKVEGIHGILQTIQGIAEQTNLLALNAAIEAARAGDQGRGFAVVADEVRDLASKTQQSTEEIASMITDLREGADRSMQAMQISNTATDNLTESINSTSEKILALFQGLSSVNDMNAQIAAASEEQALVIDDISRNTEEVKVLADNTNESSIITGKQAIELGKNSTELRELIGGFNFE